MDAAEAGPARRRVHPVAVVATVLVTAAVVLRVPADAAVQPGDAELISVPVDPATDTGFSAHAEWETPAASADGRHVAFTSFADLDPFDRADGSGTGGDADIYARDRVTGRTTLLSRGVVLQESGTASARRVGVASQLAGPPAPANGRSRAPSLSADGRYVAFHTDATNIVEPLDGAYEVVVLCDRDPDGDGVLDEAITPVDLDLDCVRLGTGSPEGGFGTNTEPQVSADGTVVSWFEGSIESNLADRLVTARVGRGPEGRLSTPDPDTYQVIDPRSFADGTIDTRGVRAAVTTADATTAVLSIEVRECPEFRPECYFRDRLYLVDLGTGRETDLATSEPWDFIDPMFEDLAIADDATVLSFTAFGQQQEGSPAPRRVAVLDRDPDDDGGAWPEFGDRELRVVSTDANGDQVDGHRGDLSSDGRYVAFSTSAADVHTGRDVPGPPFSSPGGQVEQVVVRDLVEDRRRAESELAAVSAELVSVGSTIEQCRPMDIPSFARQEPDPRPCGGNGNSGRPILTRDGGGVVYVSDASDLGVDDRYGTDVVAREFPVAVTGDVPRLGPTPLGQSTRAVFTATQGGFGPVRVNGVSIQPATDRFGVDVDGCSGAVLHWGDTCMVSVRHDAVAEGTDTADLVVDLDVGGLDDPASTVVIAYELVADAVSPGSQPPTQPPTFTPTDTPTFTPTEPPTPAPTEPPTPAPTQPPAPDDPGRPVTGPAMLRVDPPALVFTGLRRVLSQSAPLPVSVTNTGGVAVALGGVRLLDDGALRAADYRVVLDRCSGVTLAPGASCDVVVIAAPRGAGDRPGALFVDAMAPGLDQIVGLSAVGSPAALVVNPGVGRPLEVVRLIGAGLPTNHDVLLDLPGRTGPVPVRTDAAGRFEYPLVVFDGFGVGTVPVRSRVPDTELSPETTVLIVPGSYQPPGFLGRR